MTMEDLLTVFAVADDDVGRLLIISPPIYELVASTVPEWDFTHCAVPSCRLGDSKRTGELELCARFEPERGVLKIPR
jgi:hypothetical protein